MRVLIVDGYSDEPAGLGVPPYLDVYARYVAGALWEAEPRAEVVYLTIDQVRSNTRRYVEVAKGCDLVAFIAGVCVPGKYLGGEPIKLRELKELPSLVEGPLKVLGGPAARFGIGLEGGRVAKLPSEVQDVFDLIVTGDVEVVVSDLLREKLRVDKVDPARLREGFEEVDEKAVRGARIVRQHPCYGKNLVIEVETYRGCPRFITRGCSFCVEPLYGHPVFRAPKGVASEVAALYAEGVNRFRLGRQPDILCYMAKGVGEVEFPEPSPEALEKLFRAVRAAAPMVKTLHIDNVNPGTIVAHPERSEEALKVIVKYHTPGDVAAMGVESVDPAVVKANNLKVDFEGALKAMEVVNKVGRERGYSGLPHLLPGVNFVYGLINESKETFELNLEVMKEALRRGLLVRRVNIRQVMPLPGTRMWEVGNRVIRRHKALFKSYKLRMRSEFDRPMLKKLLPHWTILRDVYVETYDKSLTYARQPGSYPVLVCIRAKLELGRYRDFFVADHGYRSVTGAPYPLNINSIDRKLLESLPGIGTKRAARIIASRPFKRLKDLEIVLGDPQLALSLHQVSLIPQ
ncbi:MAG: radical SAM protein [Candidatus Nezhaarchaeota archaeon]|nr:radical SAM protein [Candidatus Nezhaarchaeota archaeon]